MTKIKSVYIDLLKLKAILFFDSKSHIADNFILLSVFCLHHLSLSASANASVLTFIRSEPQMSVRNARFTELFYGL